jgi:hypothetical protein
LADLADALGYGKHNRSFFEKLHKAGAIKFRKAPHPIGHNKYQLLIKDRSQHAEAKARLARRRAP